MYHTTPLCVDLDGTLIRTDLLLESLLLLIKRNPLYLLLTLVWLLRGKARLKQEIASRVEVDVALLPYRQRLLEYLRQQRQQGRRLLLVTASDQRYAQQVAAHVGLFDEVLASDGVNNLAGSSKAQALVARFGEQGFGYAGDRAVDLKVWQHAASAVVVSSSARLESRARGLTQLECWINDGEAWSARALVRAMRPHQWLKNLLIFVPLLASHSFSLASFAAALAAFVAFCLCASSVYLLNDMLDLEADRRHPTKCRRPFACGDLSLSAGPLWIGLLLAAGFMLALALPVQFLLVLFIYYLLTLAYSLWLKQQEILDVLLLAGLYTIRVIAGAAAIEVELSFWLLAFSMFLFLSLAMVKRYSELLALGKRGESSIAGRGYYAEDQETIGHLGTSAGYMAVLVLALYINSDTVTQLYQHPQVIWLLCPLLLYLISRIWLVARRGRMNDDPVVFVARDPNSLVVALMGAALFWMAL